tara:strand:+ start:89818 stop:90288 length:471 start_codon:yes stop_codon:yes gene_type:complete
MYSGIQSMNQHHPSSHGKPTFLLSISMLILLFSMFSCGGSLEGKLVGKWKGSDHMFVKGTGPDLVATIDGGLARHLTSTLNLNEDGTYQKLVGEYDNGSGIWMLEDDNLVLLDNNGNELNYTLLKVTENELVTIHDVSMDTPSGELSGKITLSYTR